MKNIYFVRLTQEYMDTIVDCVPEHCRIAYHDEDAIYVTTTKRHAEEIAGNMMETGNNAVIHEDGKMYAVWKGSDDKYRVYELEDCDNIAEEVRQTNVYVFNTRKEARKHAERKNAMTCEPVDDYCSYLTDAMNDGFAITDEEINYFTIIDGSAPEGPENDFSAPEEPEYDLSQDDDITEYDPDTMQPINHKAEIIREKIKALMAQVGWYPLSEWAAV